MFWFQNKRTEDILCMETTSLAEVRIHTVFDAGFYVYRYPRDPVPHRHLNYEVYFVEKGSCTAHCMGEEYTAFEGDFLLIGAGVEHNVSSLSEDASLYSFRCSFYPARKEDEGLYLKLIERLRFASALRKKTVLISLLRLIRWELSERRAMFEEKLRGLLEVFYVDFLRALLDVPAGILPMQPFSVCTPDAKELKGFPKDTPEEFYMDLLDDFFTHLPKESPTLSALARRLYLSVSQTQRLIKHYYGVSFQQKLIEAKIFKSVRLLSGTDMSLEEIAQSVGYNSYNAFFEAFSSVMGETPSHYRQSLKSNKT